MRDVERGSSLAATQYASECETIQPEVITIDEMAAPDDDISDEAKPIPDVSGECRDANKEVGDDASRESVEDGGRRVAEDEKGQEEVASRDACQAGRTLRRLCEYPLENDCSGLGRQEEHSQDKEGLSPKVSIGYPSIQSQHHSRSAPITRSA